MVTDMHHIKSNDKKKNQMMIFLGFVLSEPLSRNLRRSITSSWPKVVILKTIRCFKTYKKCLILKFENVLCKNKNNLNLLNIVFSFSVTIVAKEKKHY